jgi:diguanylate cyclase (GGDEF)-like protein/PAS domain S-box-containing protein
MGLRGAAEKAIPGQPQHRLVQRAKQAVAVAGETRTHQRHETFPRPFAIGVIAWLTLSDLPAPAALVIIAALFPASWAAAFYLGGGTVVAPHWFYLPVFLAGLRFGPLGALAAGITATFVAGPLLPADAATGAPQAMSDWISRGIFFVLIGQFVTLLFAAARQMSAREAQAEALRESEQRFRALVQRATDMIVVVDPSGTLKYESPAVERILGWKPGQRLGRAGIDFIHPDDRERVSGVLADVLARPSETRMVELRQQDSTGVWHWVESIVTNLIDESTVHGIVINHRVVDDRKSLEEELLHRAFHDSLTGLANRGLLRNRLETALVRRDRAMRCPALLFIDVDDFKTVNDGFGHASGDQLLIEISGRLLGCVRPEDLVARLGGDEFAVLIEESSTRRDAATDVAQRILDAMKAPFYVSGRESHVRTSIGIASYSGGSPSADLVLRQADIAMYHAKANGKAQYAIFSNTMDEILRSRLMIETELRAALEQDQIRVVYQPIVALATREIEAVEALVRWQHPTRGLLTPADFLGVAEDTGLIVPLGRLVLREACRQARLWRERLKSDIKVSINLSATQLNVASIVEDVRSALEKARIDPEALVLEVTEGALIADVSGMAKTIQSLRSLGVSIAIDDFGTGYSSLSHLQRFSVDAIKLDKSFVDGICRNTEGAMITRAVLAIGEEFHLQVIAEGVESDEQDAELRRLGCKSAQGYLYARPVEVDVVDGLLAGFETSYQRDGARDCTPVVTV